MPSLNPGQFLGAWPGLPKVERTPVTFRFRIPEWHHQGAFSSGYWELYETLLPLAIFPSFPLQKGSFDPPRITSKKLVKSQMEEGQHNLTHALFVTHNVFPKKIIANVIYQKTQLMLLKGKNSSVHEDTELQATGSLSHAKGPAILMDYWNSWTCPRSTSSLKGAQRMRMDKQKKHQRRKFLFKD